MAIRPVDEYPGQTTAVSPAYPSGGAVNDTTPGSNDGTPLEEKMLNDLFGFQQAILAAGGETPSGEPENAPSSQYFKTLIDFVMKLLNVFTSAFSVSNAVLSADTFDYNPTVGGFNGNDVFMRPDGKAMFIIEGAATALHQVDLLIPFKVSSGVYNGVFKNVVGTGGNLTSITFDPSGKKFFGVIGSIGFVREWSFSEAWNIQSTMTLVDSFDLTNEIPAALGIEDGPRGVSFSHSGTRMYVGDTTNDNMVQYNLTNGYSLAAGNIAYSGKSFSVASEMTAMLANFVTQDGSKLFVIKNNAPEEIFQYDVSGDIDTAAVVDSVPHASNTPAGISFSPFGHKMYVIGFSGALGEEIYEYDIPIALANKDRSSNGGTILERLSGTTANRPAGLTTDDIGFQYFDTTLNTPIWWDGNNWVDAVGATA